MQTLPNKVLGENRRQHFKYIYFKLDRIFKHVEVFEQIHKGTVNLLEVYQDYYNLRHIGVTWEGGDKMSHQYFYTLHRGADKSLARPRRKQARKHVRETRDFNKIETRAVIKFF